MWDANAPTGARESDSMQPGDVSCFSEPQYSSHLVIKYGFAQNQRKYRYQYCEGSVQEWTTLCTVVETWHGVGVRGVTNVGVLLTDRMYCVAIIGWPCRSVSRGVPLSILPVRHSSRYTVHNLLRGAQYSCDGRTCRSDK